MGISLGIGLSPVMVQDDGGIPLPPEAPVFYLQNGVEMYEDAPGTNPCEDGDEIRRWGDQSGNNNDAVQAGAGDRPVFRANQIDADRPAADFNIAADTHLDTSSSIALAAFHIFAVVRLDALSGNNTIVGGNTGSGAWLAVRNADALDTLDDGGNNITSAITGGDFATATWYLLEFSYDGSTLTGRRNGSTIRSEVRDTETFTFNVIGNTGAAADNLDGDLAELLIYSDELPAAHAAQARASINQRLGIY